MDPLCPSDISPSSPSSPVGGLRGIDSDFVPFALPKGERRGLRGDKSVLLPLALPQGRGGEPSGWLIFNLQFPAVG